MCNVIFQGSSYGVDCRLEGRTEKHTSLLLYAHSKPSRPSYMRSRREKPKKEEKIHLKSPNVQHLFLQHHALTSGANWPACLELGFLKLSLACWSRSRETGPHRKVDYKKGASILAGQRLPRSKLSKCSPKPRYNILLPVELTGQHVLSQVF